MPKTYSIRLLSSWWCALIWTLFIPLLNCQAREETITQLPSFTLTQRQLCDLELLLNGGFAPLEGFMDRETYEHVVHEMCLLDRSVWPMPIVFDVYEKDLKKLKDSPQIALKDSDGFILAILNVSDVWMPNKEVEAEKVYGTTSIEHPGVHYLFHSTGDYYVAGKLDKIALPKHYDFEDLRRTPAELKSLFKEKGIEKIVAFQTRNPMHRAHLELTNRAAQKVGAHLLIQPSVGMTKPGDIDYFTRVKCYKKIVNYYPEGSVTLSLLPLAMRMAGPREALWHALIRKNYGCTHFIVGRDHAGPGKDGNGKDFYPPYAAQELVKAYEKEIGIEIVTFQEVVYIKEDQNYQPLDEVPAGKTIQTISGTQLKKLLYEGKEIPSWFSFPEIVTELQKVYPPKSQQGFTIFLTGYSGSGKSTIANALGVKLMELQSRSLTILDGDSIRVHLSKELGFSKEHRSMNVRRIGFVANEITKNHGIAICALIAPYEEDRDYNRRLISERGNYIEVYVATPFEECEKRDPKGLYTKAKQGLIPHFTGIDDPYEPPHHPEIILNTTDSNVSEEIEIILDYLRKEGYL